MSPLVSVIMPAYNAEKYIGEAIESIINQTYQNWELIIVEDCSSDQTAKIIKRYTDKRIKALYNEKNMGIATTTNKAIQNSKGKYIALLDDDDVAEVDRLQLQVDYLELYQDIDVLGGSATYINENSKFVGFFPEPRYNPNYIKATLLFQNLEFANSTAMIRRRFIEKNQLWYQENCFGMQDYRFYMEASKIGRISAIKDFLVKYRLHSENETQKNKTLYANERYKKYSEFQTYSLEKSGYKLNQEQMSIIHRFFSATGGKFEDKEDVESLYNVLKCILVQGKEMQIDYYDELEHVCKTKLSKLFIKSDVFNWE